ncbi:hypothetical protein [Burkholderia multivorans]|uniref:hypothetical protein n=1 Tax=Burkholderia multivorans TaxID=87883 RepID=UPI001F479F4B|nr:hypothetical protein [Burkholderia multivorans]MDR8872739.1 hypothetical protein [Burkholderia multivorans]MDR8879121.1 hypothetical protein [Burkholderia multivorans]MDR8885937.1 hypothetical protein [Burkholderia multivorans]MDR8891115.1 hypothetical protein [Burkholderia multivorans]MDR8897795.1 hypothetical protein [Burkholderia multivorans]
MNALRAALAPIPAEPWDALTAERRIADHAPTPAGAARREPPRGACATMHASRAPVRETSPADAPTRLLADAPAPDQKPLNLPSSLLRPPQPAAPSARANSRLNGSDLGVYTRFLATMPRRTPI